MSQRYTALLLLLMGACAGPPDQPSAITVRVASGDDQVGPVKEYAPLALAIVAEDPAGKPLAGVPVTWTDATNGRVVALGETTSAAGRAEALFLFGNSEGPAQVTARVRGATPVTFQLRASGSISGVPYDVLQPLDLTTYDGSGETVHPDYVRTPWLGFSELLAITPYPGGDAAYENPSLFSGGSPLRWPIPSGVVNPLAHPSGNNYLSDPDILFVPETADLWLYYRSVDFQNRIFVIRSTDGVQWGPPREVVAAANHHVISPSVVYRGPGDWWMWSIDGGRTGCSDNTSRLELRRSADGILWGPPVPAPLEHDGLTPWHVDVQWIPTRQEFWAVYNAKSPGSCATPAVFLATSPDGITWTPVRQPLVSKGVTPEFKDLVYRTTFRYDAATDDLWLWISGASYGNSGWVWSTALQRRRGSEAIRASPSRAALRFPSAPAPLINWP